MILYKHDNMTDVAMQVIKSKFATRSGTYYAEVIWWRVTHKDGPWILGRDTVRIPEENLQDWKEYDWHTKMSGNSLCQHLGLTDRM